MPQAAMRWRRAPWRRKYSSRGNAVSEPEGTRSSSFWMSGSSMPGLLRLGGRGRSGEGLVQAQDQLQQDTGAGGEVGRLRPFLGAMAPPVAARDEEHADRAEPGDVIRVVAGAAREAGERHPERLGGGSRVLDHLGVDVDRLLANDGRH